ncbi:MAG: LemA family protein [Neisseriaceae bacterium]|nr:LemA family protein [Neisseriaceae bacterium]
MNKNSGQASPILITIIAIIVITAGLFLSKYNQLQTLDEATDAAWSQVLNTYKRRADLVPQVVEVVKSYTQHEKKLLTEITEARTNVGKLQLSSKELTPEKLAEFQKMQQQLSASLGRLIAVTENYPELKSNEIYQNLQAELEGSENRITVARRDYIESVRKFNTAVRRFPGNIVAKYLDMKVKPNFSVENETEIAEPPKLNLP